MTEGEEESRVIVIAGIPDRRCGWFPLHLQEGAWSSLIWPVWLVNSWIQVSDATGCREGPGDILQVRGDACRWDVLGMRQTAEGSRTGLLVPVPVARVSNPCDFHETVELTN